MEAGTLRLGDEVVITGPTTGALISTVSEIHGDDGSPVKAIDRGHDFAIAVPAKVRPGDRCIYGNRWTKTIRDTCVSNLMWTIQ